MLAGAVYAPWRSWKTHSASQRSPALESLTVYSITLWRECAGKHLIYSLAYVSVHTVSNCILTFSDYASFSGHADSIL